MRRHLLHHARAFFHAVSDRKCFAHANYSVDIVGSHNDSLVACVDTSVRVVRWSGGPSLIVEGGASVTTGGEIHHASVVSWNAVTRCGITAPMVRVEVIRHGTRVDTNVTLVREWIRRLDVDVVRDLNILTDDELFLVDADTWSMGWVET